MTEVEFLSRNIFFTTRMFANELSVGVDSASRTLRRLHINGAITQVTRGVWCQPHHPYYSPYGAVPYLLGNEQGYVSFLTALHFYGVISQIPRSIQIATTGHSRKLKSQIGEFEFFHIQPKLMREGVSIFEGKIHYNIATAEKAFFDTMYLSTRKGRRFSRLPELDTKALRARTIKTYIKHLPPIIRENLLRRLAGIAFE